MWRNNEIWDGVERNGNRNWFIFQHTSVSVEQSCGHVLEHHSINRQNLEREIDKEAYSLQGYFFSHLKFFLVTATITPRHCHQRWGALNLTNHDQENWCHHHQHCQSSPRSHLCRLHHLGSVVYLQFFMYFLRNDGSVHLFKPGVVLMRIWQALQYLCIDFPIIFILSHHAGVRIHFWLNNSEICTTLQQYYLILLWRFTELIPTFKKILERDKQAQNGEYSISATL